MKKYRIYGCFLALGFITSCADTGCMDQHNPRPYWNKLEQEEKLAHRPAEKLTKDGKLPKSQQS